MNINNSMNHDDLKNSKSESVDSETPKEPTQKKSNLWASHNNLVSKANNNNNYSSLEK